MPASPSHGVLKIVFAVHQDIVESWGGFDVAGQDSNQKCRKS